MEKRMTYRAYKKSYSNAKTVKDSYDAATKTITVIIPENREHLRFSPLEWKSVSNHYCLQGTTIRVYQWNTGAEAHFEIEAYDMTELKDGPFVFQCGVPSDWRYFWERIPGYGPDARDAAITRAKALAKTRKYTKKT